MKTSFKFIAIFLLSALFAACGKESTSQNNRNSQNVVRLPLDEGGHPDRFMEWWYGNFHLVSSTGVPIELMVAYFNKGLRIISASDENAKVFYQEPEFGIIDSPPGILNMTWSDYIVKDRWFSSEADPDSYTLQFSGLKLTGNLTFKSTRTPLLPGGGYVSWSMGNSYYYSLTRLDTAGKIFLLGDTYTVTGLGWMDHQFGDFKTRKPWEWFSVQLDDRTDLIAWNIYEPDGSISSREVTILRPDDSQVHGIPVELEPTRKWKSPETGNVYSTAWTLKVPSENIDLALSATFEEKEIPFPAINFWEGGVAVSGTNNGAPATGKAFAEITQYTE